MRKYGLFIFSMLLFSNAWADMFCPASFNSINMGDSVATVEAACGKADVKKISKKMPNQPQEWAYYVQSYPGMVGTLKTTVAFDAAGKVINISVNGAGVSQTQICGPTPIKFGDTQDMIKAVCGKPSYIDESLPQHGAPQEIETTVLRYNTSPPITLTFTDGKLTARAED